MRTESSTRKDRRLARMMWLDQVLTQPAPMGLDDLFDEAVLLSFRLHASDDGLHAGSPGRSRVEAHA